MAKKKSNSHSEDNNKPTKTQHQIADDVVDSLKSLNTKLLKETVERRHQVDSLTQINVSLKSDLNRCKSDKASLELELTGLSERAVRLEIEKELVCRFVFVQVNEMAELNGRRTVAMEERISQVERDTKKVLEEKNVIEGVKNKKELEISSLNNTLNKLVAEFDEDKSGFRAMMDEQIKYENGLRSKLSEAEKREAEVSEKYQKIKVEYDQLFQEKIAIERKVDLITSQKGLVERSLAELNGLFNELNRDLERIVIEKKVMEDERNIEEREKNELNELVHKLRKAEEQLVMKVAELEKKCVMGLEKEVTMTTQIDILVKEKQEIQESIRKLSQEKSLVMKDCNDTKNKFKNIMATLEKSSVIQINKVKQLESEICRNKAALDQATTELKNAVTNLQNEKLAVKNMHEKISKMQKGIEGTHKLETEKNALADDIHKLKNSLTKTRKEHEDTKAKLRQSEAISTQILQILKATSSICNLEDSNNMDIVQETVFGEEIKDHVTEIEAIKKAFNMLKLHVAKADKGKRFWTMVTSATTVLAAAVSFAYVTGGSC